MAFITINKENFYHNLNQIALQTGSIEKIAIVLKDNAYGHGLELMAKLASDFGIIHAVVRHTEEAQKIQAYFQTILILSDSPQKHEKYIYTINNLESIQIAPKGTKMSLKVDTGMHRNGIAIEALDDALFAIKAQGINLVGLMTHHRSADELSSEFFWQQKQFASIQRSVKKAGFSPLAIHSHNSASILRVKHFSEDLVRVGIAAYGYNTLPTVFSKCILKPVLSLYAKKIASRVFKKGQRVGYAGVFTADKEMTISTYDLGYGDGWHRMQNKAPFIIADGLAILGRVSMDFITIASTQEVLCIMNDAHDTALQRETISYEVLTSLHPKLERSVI